MHCLFQKSEVPNSAWCELEGLQRSVQKLRANHLCIDVLVSDRHRQICKWIRENLPECKHYFDVWHVGKGNFFELPYIHDNVSLYKLYYLHLLQNITIVVVSVDIYHVEGLKKKLIALSHHGTESVKTLDYGRSP